MIEEQVKWHKRKKEITIHEPKLPIEGKVYTQGLDNIVGSYKGCANYERDNHEEGKKFDTGKVRMDLLPHSALKQIAEVYTFGANKYGDRNWENGIKWSRLYGALQRHIQAFWEGKDLDEESLKKHLAHAGCCLTMLIEGYNIFPHLDDRPKRNLDITKIGLDIDEVLCDFTQGWADVYDNVSNRPDTWYYDRDMPNRFKKMQEDGILDEFYLNLKPKMKSSDIPFEPKAYVTSRPVDTKLTEKWLDLHGFPRAKVYTVGLGQSKAQVMKEAGIEIFVDDSFNNYVDLNNNGIVCYLWDAPHNQRFDVGARRIKSLKELV